MNETTVTIDNVQYLVLQKKARRLVGGKSYGLSHMVEAAVTYGFDVDFAHQHKQNPYFSMTIEVIDPKSRRRDNWLSGDADHESIKKYWPNIGKYEHWHLSDLPGLPMHYVANGLYWLEKACGISEWKTESYEPEPLQTFKNHIHYNPESDDAPQLAALLERYQGEYESPVTKKLLRQDMKARATVWLVNRAERMQKAFIADMVALGVLVPLPCVAVLKDGKLLTYCRNANAAFEYLLQHQSSSVDHAITYEGWVIQPINPQ